MIDIDQGQSGASAADREGFQQLVAEVSLGRAGIVLGLECSRLARNSADWHQLLELCGMTGTLICDEDGLYDPRNFNDRLVLGMKGQISEAELHFIRARLRGGQLSKARRGELIMPLPVGLVYDAAGHVILDPDTAIQGALPAPVHHLRGHRVGHRRVKAFRAAGLTFPWRHHKGPRKGEVDWQPLRHHTVLRVLHNPRYAGAFTYGRHREQVLPGGKTATTTAAPRGVDLLHPRRPPRIHHPGPVRGQHRQARGQRRRARPRPRRRAAPRRPRPAAGHHHLRPLRAADDRPLPPPRRPGQCPPTPASATASKTPARSAPSSPATPSTSTSASCSSTPSPRWPSKPPSRSPPNSEQRAAEADALRAAHVERARYHADLARRRYLAVDPANRLVAGTLEADWNTALRALNDAQAAYDKAREQHTGTLTAAQKDRIAQLVTDLPGIWNDPATPMRERKRIARLLLTDVTVTRTSDTITAHVRLAGGQHRTLTLPVPKPRLENPADPGRTIAAIDRLLDHHTCAEIAAILRQPRPGQRRGEPFTATMVQRVIRTYQLRSRRQRLLDAGLIPLSQMAALLGVSTAHRQDLVPRRNCQRAQRYNDKGEVLYDPPGPNPPRRPRTGRPTQPTDQHERT